MASTATQRDPRIDFFRGLALVMIYINHIPDNPLSFFTSRRYGFSDAAEIFVFIAGITAMMVIGRSYTLGGLMLGLTHTLKRLWSLFVAHVLLVFALSVVVAAASDFINTSDVMERFNFSPFFVETDKALLRIVKLSYMPNMTDILPLYIILMAMFPLVWLAMRVSPWFALGLSSAVWLIATATNTNFANYPDGLTWFFNPLTWQLMFVLGCVAYRADFLWKWAMTARAMLIIAWAFLGFALIAAAPWYVIPQLADFRVIPPEFLALNDKANLSLLRIAHFLALALAAMHLVTLKPHWLETYIGKLFRLYGRHALTVFCLGSVLAFATHIFSRAEHLPQFAVAGLSLLGLVLLGFAAATGEYFAQAAKKTAQLRQKDQAKTLT